MEGAPLKESLSAAPLLVVVGFCSRCEIVGAPCFVVCVGVKREDTLSTVLSCGDAFEFVKLLCDVTFGWAVTRGDERRELV